VINTIRVFKIIRRDKGEHHCGRLLAETSTPISIPKFPTRFPLTLASPTETQTTRGPNTTKMSSGTTRPPASSSTTAQPAEKTFFEQQREVLLKEIGVVSYQERVEGAGCEVLTRGQSFEHVLANINKLNRAMEGVIAVS
jgi:hypothetical protein